MRLSFGLLLPAIAGVAHATTAHIHGFIFTASKDLAPGTVSLTPEQVRVVLAQQLDITQYHSLNVGDSSERALELINTLGGQHPKLFDDNVTGAGSPRHLVVFLDVSLDESNSLKAEWSSRGWTEPSFVMVGNPGRSSVRSLVGDMQKQISPLELPNQHCTLTKAMDMSADECWNGRNSYITYGFTEHSVSRILPSLYNLR